MAGDNAFGDCIPDIIVPELANVRATPRAHRDGFDFLRSQRIQLADGGGAAGGLGIFDEMHRVDEHPSRRFGRDDLAVGAHLKRVMRPQCSDDGSPEFAIVDVARIRVGGNAARPAHRVDLEWRQRHIMNERERSGCVVVEMRHCTDIGTGAIDLRVEEDFGGRRAWATADDGACIIANEKILGLHLGAAFDARLDQERLFGREACADMAAIFENTEFVEHQRRRGDVEAQPGFHAGRGGFVIRHCAQIHTPAL